MKLLRNRSRLKILVNFYKKQSNYWFNEVQKLTKRLERDVDSKNWEIHCLSADLKIYRESAETFEVELKELQDKYVNLLASSIILEKKLNDKN